MLLPAVLLWLLRFLLRFLLWLWLGLRRLRGQLLRVLLLWIWLRGRRGLRRLRRLRELLRELLWIQLLRPLWVLRPRVLPAHACLRDQMKTFPPSTEAAQWRASTCSRWRPPCVQDLPCTPRDGVLPLVLTCS